MWSVSWTDGRLGFPLADTDAGPANVKKTKAEGCRGAGSPRGWAPGRPQKVVAGAEVGGRQVCGIPWGGELLVRADGLRAYVGSAHETENIVR